jgi:hypothetical protein
MLLAVASLSHLNLVVQLVIWIIVRRKILLVALLHGSSLDLDKDSSCSPSSLDLFHWLRYHTGAHSFDDVFISKEHRLFYIFHYIRYILAETCMTRVSLLVEDKEWRFIEVLSLNTRSWEIFITEPQHYNFYFHKTPTSKIIVSQNT